MKHSYKGDCIFLLKDLSNDIKEITVQEKEELIRAGVSYSEMISKEATPSNEIIDIFLSMLERDKNKIAFYVGKLSEIIYKEKGDNLVLASLARAGTPYGILIRKYLKFKYNVDIPHYSISIIRGKGIDENALRFILREHKVAKIQFVDGWTGKGSITKELNKSIMDFNDKYNANIDDSLAVISDPAKLCSIYGTREDMGLATCCLNSTVSGLISRTVHNDKYVGRDDFHGAKYLDYLEEVDYSQFFINEVEREFKNIEDIDLNEEELESVQEEYSLNITKKIQEEYKVKSINNVKLSVGESARVLLRRDPRVVLVKDINDKNIEHIIQLSREKNIEVVQYDTFDYNCIAIIKEK
ncbi:cysteine protease StiP domain-containing protein [Clostridium sp.]|uniref:cysteine protease StiP domain-containing protein n=1 Tax=Clostridium sp. TaxID=1506 RepID=UPI003F3F0412